MKCNANHLNLKQDLSELELKGLHEVINRSFFAPRLLEMRSEAVNKTGSGNVKTEMH